MSVSSPTTTQTYTNPVYQHDFPDPFVLKYGNDYWAYGTGIAADGRCFGILHSRDLVTWESLGGAMEPLPGTFPCYWAPEVTYDNGLFYLYYSVGDEATMTVRVATALDPAGPFTDSGHILTHEPFAIDPHVFQDVDGVRYLFYATDFLEHTHVGTGTVYDRFIDPFTLNGTPRPVTRAKYDWQVYDPQRLEKGGVRWHTIEGPFVLQHKGHYYQMFSGGNWQNPTYGVSYATTTDLNTPDEWTQASDGESVLPILRTYPDLGVIGPGHNAVVLAPDNRHYYCVYHRWAADGSGRQMAIDPMEWIGERMVVRGPSTTPQPFPPISILSGVAKDERWQLRGGEWAIENDQWLQTVASDTAEAYHHTNSPFFLLEVLVRAAGNGGAGIHLYNEAGQAVIRVILHPTSGHLTISVENHTQTFPLPSTFNAAAFHALRLEVNGHAIMVSMNGAMVRWQGISRTPISGVALATHDSTAEFKGFALTEGWEDLWMAEVPLSALGWHTTRPAIDDHWKIADHQLWGNGANGNSTLVKGELFDTYELVINVRFAADNEDGSYALYPTWGETQPGPALAVHRRSGVYQLHWANTPLSLELPEAFASLSYRQFRFLRERSRLTVWCESLLLTETVIPTDPTRIALQVQDTTVAFDMVRLTVQP